MTYTPSSDIFGTTRCEDQDRIFQKMSFYEPRSQKPTISTRGRLVNEARKHHMHKRRHKFSSLASQGLFGVAAKRMKQIIKNQSSQAVGKETIQAHKTPQLVSVYSLLRQSQNLFSQLEIAIMQEDIIEKVHSLQITTNQDVQPDEATNNFDNVWIRCQRNAASTAKEQEPIAESIEQLVNITRSVLQSDAIFTAHGDGHSNPSDQSRTGAWSSFASSSGPSELTSPKKRKSQSWGNDPGDENSDSEKDCPRRPMKTLKLESSLTRRRFACPYFKRSPNRHMHQRSCAGPGWPSVHRLK